ncbi:hypothetical protein C8F01DRAFT_1092618 [Mycena amicta]|nr:hypothetical protein C8F01DRAFT_1092618 [Mycena amicta]
MVTFPHLFIRAAYQQCAEYLLVQRKLVMVMSKAKWLTDGDEGALQRGEIMRGDQWSFWCSGSSFWQTGVVCGGSTVPRRACLRRGVDVGSAGRRRPDALVKVDCTEAIVLEGSGAPKAAANTSKEWVTWLLVGSMGKVDTTRNSFLFLAVLLALAILLEVRMEATEEILNSISRHLSRTRWDWGAEGRYSWQRLVVQDVPVRINAFSGHILAFSSRILAFQSKLSARSHLEALGKHAELDDAPFTLLASESATLFPTRSYLSQGAASRL